MKRDVAVCIPTIPPRVELLDRALRSVLEQEEPIEGITVAVDHRKEGAGPTRNRAIDSAVASAWIAFLDDDDWMLPEHLRVLLDCAEETGADVVYPWFTVIGGSDPFPERFGETWSNDEPKIIPVTCIVRAELARVARFARRDTWDDEAEKWPGDDWPFWRGIMAQGAKIVHLPQRTWIWRHHPGNLSGLPTW